jgi:hypothetical protein
MISCMKFINNDLAILQHRDDTKVRALHDNVAIAMSGVVNLSCRSSPNHFSNACAPIFEIHCIHVLYPSIDNTAVQMSDAPSLTGSPVIDF